MTRRPTATMAYWVAPLIGVLGCDAPHAKETPKPIPAAKVSAPTKEDDLTTVTLTPEAEARLGIVTVQVDRKAIPRTRMLGGEVVIPPGRAVPVSVPITGTLLAVGDGIPLPGVRVRRGQPIFSLAPLVSADSKATLVPLRVEADGQVDQANDQLQVAKITLDRAEDLFRKKLGGQGAVVDARAQFELAQTRLRAAEDRRGALVKAEDGTLTPTDIVAPADGVLRNVHAQANQMVAAGAMLFEVVSLDTVWVRVPVYVGDLAVIDPEKDARVGALSDPRGYETRPAKPVPAPPSADPIAVTADLFYEVENRSNALRPGQKVNVTLPLAGEEEGLVVPRAALLLDIHGGEWVYEAVGPHAYARRRVEVDRIAGPDAVLARGSRPGARVVTDGSAELFGTEFGPAK